MENGNIKNLLQQFLDCRETTSVIAEKALKSLNEEAISHVIGEEGKCLAIVEKIEIANLESLQKYKEGFLASKNRMTSEKHYLEIFLSGKGMVNLAGNAFGTGILAQREQQTWQILQNKSKALETTVLPYPSFGIMFGWGFFIIVAYLLVQNKKGKFKGITREGVRLYFSEQHKKFGDFLTNFFKNDEK